MPKLRPQPVGICQKQSDSPKSPADKVKIKPRWSMDTVEAEMEEGINVRTKSDTKTCRIKGVTILDEDRTLALTDEDNQSVKLVDIQRNTVVSQIGLPDWPWDITKVTPDQLAVTLPAPQKIQFLSVTGTSLSLGHEMKVSGGCFGIAANQNDQLFVSFTDPAKVQVIDMTGCVLKTINDQTLGEELFVYPYYLTLSVDNSLLYVSDSGTSSVCCLDMSGNVKGKYQLEGDIMGVTIAEDDSVIVCALKSNNLQIMPSDCSRGKVLVERTCVFLPSCVIYSRAQSTLYVGQSNDTLHMFKLK